MSSWQLSASSKRNLVGVHPALIKVILRALQISPYDFGILCGVRTPTEQAKRLAEGATRTKGSYHFIQADGYSHAFDFGVYVDGQYINGDTPDELGYYRKVMQAIFTAAIELNVQIEAGGLWRTFVDAGHVQLNRKYPRG